jgi:hypothetical protein
MSSPSFERANLISCQSKIISEKMYLGINHKHVYNLHYIEIPYLVACKFDLKDGDCLIWRYYPDKRAAIVTKREGWKSREARLSRKNAGNEKANSTIAACT